MVKRACGVSLVGLLLLAAQADVRSPSPVSEPASAGADDVLTDGFWYYEDDASGDEAFQFVRPLGAAAHNRLLTWDQEGPDADVEPSEVAMLPSCIGCGFLSVSIPRGEQGQEPVWEIYRYTVTPDRKLELRALDPVRLEIAVKAGKVPGRIRPPEGRPDAPSEVALAASASELRTFLEGIGRDCFCDEPEVVLVKRATPPMKHAEP